MIPVVPAATKNVAPKSRNRRADLGLIQWYARGTGRAFVRGNFGDGFPATLDKGNDVLVALGKNNGLIAVDDGRDPGRPAPDRQKLHFPH